MILLPCFHFVHIILGDNLINIDNRVDNGFAFVERNDCMFILVTDKLVCRYADNQIVTLCLGFSQKIEMTYMKQIEHTCRIAYCISRLWIIHVKELLKTIHLPFLVACKLAHINILLELMTLRTLPIFEICIDWTWHRHLVWHWNIRILPMHKFSYQILWFAITNSIQVQGICHS